MKFIITGADGQLGSSIRKLKGAFPEHKFLFTDIGTLDITLDDAVRNYLDEHQPDVMINCAAYTAVDKAESEQKLAELLNAKAPAILGNACKKKAIPLIHVSTDYVFSGQSYVPYSENDSPDSQSAYGKTKLAGEQELINTGANGAIVRTSWLYSEFGGNFVKTMLKLGREREKLPVVFDQVGCPTYASDLALILIKLAEKNLKGMELYHFADEGVCSWYDFAIEIMKIKKLECTIQPILTKDYPTPAKRPPYSVFNKEKIKQKLQATIPHWRDSLITCLNEL